MIAELVQRLAPWAPSLPQNNRTDKGVKIQRPATRRPLFVVCANAGSLAYCAKSDDFDVPGEDPALAAVLDSDVGPRSYIVENLHLGSFVKDEQVGGGVG